MPRDQVEDDPGYQQIIPYAIFRHADRYLLTRRLQASGEMRLRDLYSLGVGGHINPEDVEAGDPVTYGLRREWEEEIIYQGSFEVRPWGLLKDDSSPVSRVHLGIVFLIEGGTPLIEIREHHKLSGELLTLSEMRACYPQMESWSRLVYDRLVGGKL
jgi:predicted NUDIX family phosphoesterase